MGDRALPASELAATAQVASWHLHRLVDLGLLTSERHGYYRLAGADLAAALEALQVIAPRERVRSLRQSEAVTRLRLARTCYDHLAGRLGIALAQALLRDGVIVQHDADFRLTPRGSEQLEELGIHADRLGHTRRRLAPCCLDWSERTYHIAGALGAALYQRLGELGWVLPHAGDRAVHITPEGHAGLKQVLRVDLAIPKELEPCKPRFDMAAEPRRYAPGGRGPAA